MNNLFKVEIYDSRWEDAGVRVTAKINGNEFVYPNVSGVEWVKTGPDMPPGLFKIPPSDQFQIVFSMEAKEPGNSPPQRFVSQEMLVFDKQALPKSGSYRVSMSLDRRK